MKFDIHGWLEATPEVQSLSLDDAEDRRRLADLLGAVEIREDTAAELVTAQILAIVRQTNYTTKSIARLLALYFEWRLRPFGAQYGKFNDFLAAFRRKNNV